MRNRKREISREYCDIIIMMIMMTISIGSLCGDYISRPISTLIRIRSDGSSRYRAAARFLVVVVSEVRKGLRHLSNSAQCYNNTKHQSFHAKTASQLFLVLLSLQWQYSRTTQRLNFVSDRTNCVDKFLRGGKLRRGIPEPSIHHKPIFLRK